MRACLTAFLLLALVAVAAGQEAKQSEAKPDTPQPKRVAPWSLLLDPVCPVEQTPWTAAKELRVSYFPEAESAKVKDPKSLTLFMVLNGENWADNKVSAKFERKEDRWEAVVPSEKLNFSYAIFYVKDETSNQVDDNGGQYWDVVFCEPTGKKSENGVTLQAQTYNGRSLPFAIRRELDYTKAIAILKPLLPVPGQQFGWPFQQALRLTWEYQAKLDGDNAEAYAKLQRQIEQFMTDHHDSPLARRSAGSAVVRLAEKLPAAFVESVISTVDAKQPGSKHPLREQYAFTKSLRERDLRKRAESLSYYVKTYPNGLNVHNAQWMLIDALIQANDVPAVEREYKAFVQMPLTKDYLANPQTTKYHLAMSAVNFARMLIDKTKRYDEALKLLDDAERLQKEINPAVSSVEQYWNAQHSALRARAYLGLKQPKRAVEPAQRAVDANKNPAYYLVLAEALGGSGEKQEAVDAYLESVLMPSNNDQANRAKLANYYLKNRMGTLAQLDALIARRRQERFAAAKYKPELKDTPAPEFSFTTRKGEKFDAATLRAKTVVVNFWSPG